ncbi:sensor histidine kinase [Roseiflexus castenholzii]|jgi:two-component system NtrC family sensor kinase|uniref:histidine kinase n=1 Tax=Roseiflexus castenholzii (strain DSM 13941 / HLO8) TaxID=383372 RepID=A7NQL8_ROSCS|nr:ATP-binding protein [Roseiflexus castenholzii]ABU59864.1 GAF sensor signal transduction histidine kinase [Roseiflexus castenholzii DSM 13941]
MKQKSVSPTRHTRRSVNGQPDDIAHLRAELTAAYARIAELEAQMAVSVQRANLANERLNAILTISAALLITHEIDTILQLVVREAVQLFPGAHGALLFLADQSGLRLRLVASSSGKTTGLSLRPGQSLAGRAFLSPRAMLLAGPELEATLSELSEAQLAQKKKVLGFWPPGSALMAPLRIEDTRLGALVLYGNQNPHLTHPRDIPFIQALADLTAVAIAEHRQRARAAALQQDLDQTQSLHAEAQARLNAAQAQLLQSAKLAAVGELAASVAHEINNPLYAARNSLYLVEQDIPPDTPQRHFLTIAQNELGRIARIITRMRDFYRPARDELEPTEINDLLAETIELVQTHLRHGQVTVTVDFCPNLPRLIAHPDQLRQVFLNLMLNACDAMPHGGQLHITTELSCENDADAQYVVISIRDSGTGINPEHMPHLFEPFYTTKPQGTGLGLAISAHIVTQHGGHIQVESEPGAGSTFTVLLPVDRGEKEEGVTD